jgi:hypothetical protein
MILKVITLSLNRNLSLDNTFDNSSTLSELKNDETIVPIQIPFS